MVHCSNMKNPWVIIGVIVVVLFGSAIWFSSQAEQRNNEGVVVKEHILGNPDAETVLVEYSDLQCPACASFHPVVKQLMEDFEEDIRFEYRHFPLPIHPYAQQAAVAAEAAGQQDKFFEYHDLLFENQSDWSAAAAPVVFFVEYAEALDLDIELFRRHLNSSVLRDKVRAELAEGRERGVNSTPSFYLDDVYLNPDEFRTFEGFVQRVAVEANSEKAAELYGVSTSTTDATEGSDIRFGI